MIDLLVILSGLLTFAAIFIWYRRMFRYRDVFQQLPEPVLRVSISTLEPTLCNRAFSSLLGYRNPDECCRYFANSPHLPDQNLYQIWQENMTEPTQSRRITILDRQGTKVASEARVQVDNRHMDLIVTAIDNATETADVLTRQDVSGYLELDEDLVIRKCNVVAATQLNAVTGSSLAAVAFPAPLRSRLERIYLGRLSKHGKLALAHMTRLDGAEVYCRWWLSRAENGDGYAALFHGQQSDSLPLSSPLYNLQDNQVGFWEMDKSSHQMRHNRAWLDHLGYDAVPTETPSTFLISLIVPEDRDRIEALLSDPPDSFSAIYRMATASGVQISIETRGLVRQRDEGGGVLVAHGIHINRTRSLSDETDSANSPLVRTAENLGYRTHNAADISLNLSDHQIEGILSGIAEFLRSEFGDVSKTLRAPDEQPAVRCSTCNDIQSRASLMISCSNVEVPHNLVAHLLSPGFSLSHIDSADSSGLAKVNRRIHDVGGHMTVSHPGDGVLELAISLPHHAHAGDTQIDILIVDDEPIVAHYLEEVVSKAGYSVMVMTSSAEALAVFRKNPGQFHMVITDQNMPVYSGDMLIREFLALRPDLPIVVCTGFSDRLTRTAALELGAVDYMQKPVDVPRLLNVVQHARRLASNVPGQQRLA
jgi:CheY-like chemotaxis protein/PAS domain-containing protein